MCASAHSTQLGKRTLGLGYLVALASRLAIQAHARRPPMRSIQHTITTLLLTASVVGGAALVLGTRTQLEQFRRDVGEIQAVIHGVASTWDEFSEAQ